MPDLLIAREGRYRVFYAPFDWANPTAKVVILGISPGWTQMELACRAARDALAAALSGDEICRAAKMHGSFAGPMRATLVRMLDDIGLAEALGLRSSSELFGSARHLLHTASAIRYPVFLESRNYTGSPHPQRIPLLMGVVREVLAPELNLVSDALITPLGKSVEGVLEALASEGRLRAGRWLSGFPHPSGANGHRVRLFEEHLPPLRRQVQAVFGKVTPAAQQPNGADGAGATACAPRLSAKRWADKRTVQVVTVVAAGLLAWLALVILTR